MDYRFTLFDSPVGRCGIVWSERGIAGVQFPESDPAATRARLLDEFPGATEQEPPPQVRHAIDAILALLRGEPADLSDVVLDMEGLPPFHRRVYEAARAIPPGQTLSYGELAARCGAPRAARAVGQALGRNPFCILVPCHRVVAANGKAGGFSANGGVATKLRLLAIEGVHVEEPPAPRRDEAASALPFDPRAAEAHLRAADPVLARLIATLGPFHLPLDRAPSVFLALAQAIVYQQLSGRVASAIYGRVCALFPDSNPGPTPEDILGASDEALRGAGLSRAKLLALRDLSQRTVAGEIPPLAEARRMEDEAIVERLTRVRGIGRWTVEMLLIFRLGRPDVLPVGDYGVRRGFALAWDLADLPSPKELQARGERWRPYRTMATWYLWRAADQTPS